MEAVMKKVFLNLFILFVPLSTLAFEPSTKHGSEYIWLQYGTESVNPPGGMGSAKVSFSKLPLAGLTLQIGDKKYTENPGTVELPIGSYDVFLKYHDAVLYEKTLEVVAGTKRMRYEQVCSHPKTFINYTTSSSFRNDIVFDYEIARSGDVVNISYAGDGEENTVVSEQRERLAGMKFCPWGQNGQSIEGRSHRIIFVFSEPDKAGAEADHKAKARSKEVAEVRVKPEKAFVFGLFANRAQIGESTIDDFETDSFSEVGLSIGYRKESTWKWLDKRWFWDTDLSLGTGFGSTRKVQSLRCTSDFVSSEYCSMQLRQQIVSGSVSMLATHELKNWKVLYGAGLSYFNIRNRLLLNGSASVSEYDSVSSSGVVPMFKVGINNREIEYSYVFMPTVGGDATGSGPYHQLNFSFYALQ